MGDVTLEASITDAVAEAIAARAADLIAVAATSQRLWFSEDALRELGLGAKDAERVWRECPKFAAPGEDARRRYVRREDVVKAMREVTS